MNRRKPRLGRTPSMDQKPAPQPGEVEALAEWLRGLAERGEKGTVSGIDARALGRCAAALADLQAQVGAKDALCERLKQEAEIHAQESRTQHSIVHEIYQVISGGKGEPGTWNGAQPVRDYVAAMEQECEELRRPHATDYRCGKCGRVWHADKGAEPCPWCRAESAEAERDEARRTADTMRDLLEDARAGQDALASELRATRASFTALQEYNNQEVERRRKAEDELKSCEVCLDANRREVSKLAGEAADLYKEKRELRGELRKRGLEYERQAEELELVLTWAKDLHDLARHGLVLLAGSLGIYTSPVYPDPASLYHELYRHMAQAGAARVALHPLTRAAKKAKSS